MKVLVKEERQPEVRERFPLQSFSGDGLQPHVYVFSISASCLCVYIFLYKFDQT
jgi:hypothetical protein